MGKKFKERLPHRPEGGQWIKIETSRPWKPQMNGEILEGEYGGFVEKSNANGEYKQFLVHGYTKSWYVTGQSVSDLFQTANIEPGTRVKVVFVGKKRAKISGFEFRQFELYVQVDET